MDQASEGRDDREEPTREEGMNFVQDKKLTSLSEENILLRKHLTKQEGQIRQLATKVVRVMSERKSKEKRDDQLIENQKSRIAELEEHVNDLRNKLSVSRTQLTSYTRMIPSPSHPSASAKSLQNQIKTGIPPKHLRHPHEGGDISPKVQMLLLEAKAENQALEDKVRMLRDELKKCEDERDSLKDDLKVKVMEHEEEMTSLRRQLESSTEVKQKKIADNIQIIRLQRESKRAASWVATLEAQVASLEGQLAAGAEAVKGQEAALQALGDDLREEQKRALGLQKEADESQARAIRIKDLETQLHAIQEDNRIIKEANDSLLSKAFNHAEKTRAEREELHTLEETIAKLKEEIKHEVRAKEDVLGALDEEKKRVWELQKSVQNEQRAKTIENVQIPQEPKVTVTPPTPQGPSPCEKCRSLDLELQQGRWELGHVRDELTRTKNLLLAQLVMNKESQKEIESLGQRLEKADSKHTEKLEEFMANLAARAEKIEALERSLQSIKEKPQIVINKSPRRPQRSEIESKESGSDWDEPTPNPIKEKPLPEIKVAGDGEVKDPILEIHIESFVGEAEVAIGPVFATWEMEGEEGKTEYSPVVSGGHLRSSSKHPLKGHDLPDEVSFKIQVHEAIGEEDCKTLGSGTLVCPLRTLKSGDLIRSTALLHSDDGFQVGQVTYFFMVIGSRDPKAKDSSDQVNNNVSSAPTPVPRKRTKSPEPEPNEDVLNTTFTTSVTSSPTPTPQEPKKSPQKQFLTPPEERNGIQTDFRSQSPPKNNVNIMFPTSFKGQKVKSPSGSPSKTLATLPEIKEIRPNTTLTQPSPKKPILRSNSSPSTSPKVKKRVTLSEEKPTIRIKIIWVSFTGNAPIWTNSNVKNLFVEFKFLDFPPEDTEVPSNKPKPSGPGQRVNFDFAGEYPIDSGVRVQALKDLMASGRKIPFTVVSEPDENDENQCEDIGVAHFDLGEVQRAQKDLSEQKLTLFDPEESGAIGTLLVSVEAFRALNSLL